MNREINHDENSFALAPALAAEALDQIDLTLSRVILRDEARWPWVVLVPRRVGVSEIFDLLPGDRTQLMAEIAEVSAALKSATGADKINIAQFGNMCRQLHVHVLARTENDANWPGGVVGAGPREERETAELPRWWGELCRNCRSIQCT